MTVLQDWKIWE